MNATQLCPRTVVPLASGLLPRIQPRRLLPPPITSSRPERFPRPLLSQNRQKVARLRASRYKDVEIVPGLTLVETIVVSAPVRQQYTRLVCCLMSFVFGWTADPTPKIPPLDLKQSLGALDSLPADDVDGEVVEWTDAALRSGVAGHNGQKLMAALAWVRPKFRKGGEVSLPRSRVGSLALFRRSPGATRQPLPEPVVYAMASRMVALLGSGEKGRNVGLCVIVAHHLYLRPGELARIQWEWIVPAALGSRERGRQCSIVLHPSEEQVPSKVGLFDETLLVDLEPAVLELQRFRARHHNGPFLPLTSRQFNKFWRQAALDLQLDKSIGVPHPYALRHSGPSADRLHQRRPLSEVKSRGRWRADSSVRRYQKGGRSLERLSVLTAAMQQYVHQCERRLFRVLSGHLSPLCKPAV